MFRSLCWCVAILSVTCCVARPATAQRPDRGAIPKEFRGTITAVDLNAQTITVSGSIAGRGEPMPSKTFHIAKNAEVAIGSATDRRQMFKAGKLTDLVTGAQVQLSLTDDETTAESLVVQGPLVRGTVKSIDAGKKQITVSVFNAARQNRENREAGFEEKTFSIADKAEVGIDDGRGRRFSVREGTLAEISAGATVMLELTIDQKSVHAIHAEGESRFGVLKALDASKRTITLVTGGMGRGGDAAGDERQWPVAADASIAIDDGRGKRLSVKETTLAEIPQGSAVRVRLSVDQTQVMQLTAEGPTMQGMITKVDAEKRLITVEFGGTRTEKATEKSLSVADEARVVIDGTAGRSLADIKPTDPGLPAMLRLSLDQKSVQMVIVAGRGR